MIPDERFSDIVKLHDGHPDSESHAEPFRPPDEFVSISDVDFILLMLMLLPEKYGKPLIMSDFYKKSRKQCKTEII
jgi:hypothetical protein